jgi:DNA-binding MarR family transcriptional regulator
MSEELDKMYQILELMVKRKRIILELYPRKQLQQSDLAKKTAIANSNLSRYISELEEKKITNISTSVNDKGQPIKLISLARIPIDIIKASDELVSTGKPKLRDFESLRVFMDGLFKPDLQEPSKNSIQLISNQYIVPIESGFFQFLSEHLMDEELIDARRVLVVSARNMVREMDENSKRNVLSVLEPVLQSLLQDAQIGLQNETKNLLQELGVYNLSFEKLVKLYTSEIQNHKVPGFFRSLILNNHRDKIPKLRASLIKLHPKLDEEARSILNMEFPLLR